MLAWSPRGPENKYDINSASGTRQPTSPRVLNSEKLVGARLHDCTIVVELNVGRPTNPASRSNHGSKGTRSPLAMCCTGSHESTRAPFSCNAAVKWPRGRLGAHTHAIHGVSPHSRVLIDPQHGNFNFALASAPHRSTCPM
jgi:hypothetical protein